MMELYDRIVDKNLLVRRITICANHIIPEDTASIGKDFEQLDFFTDYAVAEEKQKQERTAADIGLARMIVNAKYSCGFPDFQVSLIIVGVRYLDCFATIMEDRLWQVLTKPVFRWQNRSGLSMNAARAV